MSNGWVCDKCDRHFLQDSTEKRYHIAAWVYRNRSPESENNLDLCENCKQRHDAWIEDKPYSHCLGSDFAFEITDESPVYADDLVYRNPYYEDVPRVYFGNVHPLPNSSLEDKEFPKKMLEEAAEVYSAWEDYVEAMAKDDDEEAMKCLRHIEYECGDVIQTGGNMLSAAQKAAQEIKPTLYEYNVYNASPLMADIERRNRKKGRYDVNNPSKPNPFVGLVRGKHWERREASDYYCGKCGWKVTDHYSYCPECGGALHGANDDAPNEEYLEENDVACS